MTKRIYKKDDDNDDTNKNRTSRNKTGAQGNNERNNKRKVIVTGNSLLDGISGRGLSKDQQVKIHNFPGITSETILKEINILIFDKPDCIIILAITNDISNSITSLNSVKKIAKKVKQTYRNTKTVFSNLITRKDRDLGKNVQDVNHRLKNYCAQTNSGYLENNNINLFSINVPLPYP